MAANNLVRAPAVMAGSCARVWLRRRADDTSGGSLRFIFRSRTPRDARRLLSGTAICVRRSVCPYSDAYQPAPRPQGAVRRQQSALNTGAYTRCAGCLMGRGAIPRKCCPRGFPALSRDLRARGGIVHVLVAEADGSAAEPNAAAMRTFFSAANSRLSAARVGDGGAERAFWLAPAEAVAVKRRGERLSAAAPNAACTVPLASTNSGLTGAEAPAHAPSHGPRNRLLRFPVSEEAVSRAVARAAFCSAACLRASRLSRWGASEATRGMRSRRRARAPQLRGRKYLRSLHPLREIAADAEPCRAIHKRSSQSCQHERQGEARSLQARVAASEAGSSGGGPGLGRGPPCQQSTPLRKSGGALMKTLALHAAVSAVSADDAALTAAFSFSAFRH